MKLVFMGTPDFAVPVLKALAEAGHEIGYVVTQPDKARNRNRVTFSPVKEAALAMGIEILQPTRLSEDEECIKRLRDWGPEAVVVVAYGQILKRDVLELPVLGCYNVHASLLPRWRGAAPMQRAILEGDKVTGVTIMKMAEGLDTGDIVSRAETVIGEKNFAQIHDELAVMGASLMVETLDKILSGEAAFVPQDEPLATYAAKVSKQEGKIDFSAGAARVLRKIRAFDPWPGAFCEMQGKMVKFWEGALTGEKISAEDGCVIGTDKTGFLVASGGEILRITQLQVPGKKRVPAADYLRGHALEAGEILK